jgi:hypothetical protein
MRLVKYVPNLPAKSVFVSLTHSGTLAYYTGRDVVRWQGFHVATKLDAAVDYFRSNGYSVYLVADIGEMKGFREQFARTRTVTEMVPANGIVLDDPVLYAIGGTPAPPPP